MARSGAKILLRWRNSPFVGLPILPRQTCFIKDNLVVSDRVFGGAGMKKRICWVAMVYPLLFQPALADTRDDVWAAMQRCQALQDDRTWLECTYGAKQPMRAKLGLPPAPDYQQRLVPTEPLPASASANIQLPKAALAPKPRSSFLGNTTPVTVSTLARVQYDNRGAFVVTLDNGQIWRQVNLESGRKAALRIGTKVAITPGVLWTYTLKSIDDSFSYKVERRS
ncbi:MAG: hypothetical protein H7X89_00300 [Rhizobiales bacterium]|nr:hypothetical protein [Hyphomicrobiales bacterium]